ncbi:MAG: transketolase [Rhodospirillaceae bacterium]|nr:MAG: transketolase [Rhodospirillaceae bacterium]
MTTYDILKDSPALDERSFHLRAMVLDTLIVAGRGHPGPALSLIEIMRVLYDDVLNIRPNEPNWEDRDRCILSKGHGCLALYSILADKGYFPEEDLKTFCEFDSYLGGHPEYGKVPGVEASTGALGHGLSIGVGFALSARIHKKDWRTFVIMGDGEINEGAVWEAAMAASKYELGNLTAIIDYNKIQSYGPTSDVLDMEPMADKWRSFGFNPVEVDGHDVQALQKVFGALSVEPTKPTVVICHTVKGKGIPVAEHNPMWHHKNALKDDELASINSALGRD